MNIFKVMASGRKRFPEEIASAFLAYLLNPNMDHGLGYAFLKTFLCQVAKMSPDGAKKDLQQIAENMRLRLRSSKDGAVQFECYLEKRAADSYIDVVLQIDDWWISIENKLYRSAVNADGCQIQAQYDGLQELRDADEDDSNRHIAVIYLVPDEKLTLAREEVKRLQLCSHRLDVKQLWTWKAGSADCPSIEDLLRKLLQDDTECKMTPLNDYLRHTLRALCSFIHTGFSGYAFEAPIQRGGLNKATEEVLDFPQLQQKSVGYVGIQGGLQGLVKYHAGGLDTTQRTYQYTTSAMEGQRNWLPLAKFKDAVAWLDGGAKMEEDWSGIMPALALLYIAKSYGDDVYIGIQGGKSAVEKMDREDVENKRWEISTEQRTGNWIPGADFARILEDKGAFADLQWRWPEHLRPARAEESSDLNQA